MISLVSRVGGQPANRRRGAGFGIIVWVALALGAAAPVYGQGMPVDARKNIHALFNGHDQLQRTLTLTEDGYEAVTQCEDEQLAAVLREHVRQMQERMESGLAARRWDPAFAEFRQYYDQIEVTVEPMEAGVKVVARGKTPEAVKVAQNHARVINAFVDEGWAAHDVRHPAALAKPAAATAVPGSGKGCCMARKVCDGASGCGGCGGASSAPAAD